MLKVDVAASDGQSAINEDVVGHCATAAWVIDGATGVGAALLEEPSDAAWLAQTASRILHETLCASPDQPTVDIMRSVMATCANALEEHCIRPADGPHEHPSAAFAMVRIIDGHVEFTTLADCRVAYVDHAGESRLFGTTPLEAIEARTIALAERIMRETPGIAADDLKAQLMPVLRENRRLMNKEGGYWVLGTDPAAADHLDQTRFPVRPGQRFALASDGFLRLIELFAVATSRDLIDIVTPDGWTDWLGRLRAIEREQGSQQRFPRVKIHDDASFLSCIHIGEE